MVSDIPGILKRQQGESVKFLLPLAWWTTYSLLPLRPLVSKAFYLFIANYFTMQLIFHTSSYTVLTKWINKHSNTDQYTSCYSPSWPVWIMGIVTARILTGWHARIHIWYPNGWIDGRTNTRRTHAHIGQKSGTNEKGGAKLSRNFLLTSLKRLRFSNTS